MPNDDTQSNVTDATRREAYVTALKAKQAEELAKAEHDKALGAYRGVLKHFKKLGVNPDAITYALKARFEDPDEIVMQEREKLEMLGLSGVVPDIQTKIAGTMSVSEPTSDEEEVGAVLAAFDKGVTAGKRGASRDENPYPAGSLGFLKWHEGWFAGQKAIAYEMASTVDEEVEPAPKVVPLEPLGTKRRGRPPGSKNKPGGGHVNGATVPFKPATQADVAKAIAEDDAARHGEMDDIPDIVA